VKLRCWLLLVLLLQDGQEFLKLLLTKLEHTFAASCQQVGPADNRSNWLIARSFSGVWTPRYVQLHIQINLPFAAAAVSSSII
jgi:hypothetical protein